MMRPKSNPIRSEAYRRAVAALPCIRCGIHGYSQCAHGPTLGRGIKASDLDTFPLCCTRPGVVGCHVEYDQYTLGTHGFSRGLREQWARMFAAQTQRTIYEAGDWPAKLPIPEFLKEAA